MEHGEGLKADISSLIKFGLVLLLLLWVAHGLGKMGREVPIPENQRPEWDSQTYP